MTPQAAYRTREVTKYTGLLYRTVDHWARTGFIAPSVADAKGTGTERLYSFEDLVRILVARELRIFGVTTAEIKPRLEQVKATTKRLVWSRSGEIISVVVDVGKVRQQLWRTIGKSG